MILPLLLALAAQTDLGQFEGQTDIGALSRPGVAHHDEAKHEYRITASGENMWANSDNFHFVWKKITPGDVSLTAEIAILTTTGNGHRKGLLMMRQSLDPDSAYVSAALHGDGLASIQSRPEKGANTYEVQSNTPHPRTLRLSKRGDFVYLWVGSSAKDLHFSGGSMRLKLTDPFYIGLGACSHEKDTAVEVAFENVKIDRKQPPAGKPVRFSTLETVPFPSGDRRAIYTTPGTLQGPTWTRDGGSLIVNRDGKPERVYLAPGKPSEPLNLGKTPLPCDSFQGVSPDGKRLAITCGARPSVYEVPLDGGTVFKRITHKIPTIFHAWSPDGQTLLYSSEHKDKTDLYRIPSRGGGKETRITSNGSSDNPEFSHDGKSIFYNSDALGSMQIWQMPGGSITNDEFNNWYPHVSPDGKRVLMLSCDKSVKGPPEDGEVLLRVLTLDTKRIQIIARVLIGGRGTIDSPAWSPDGRKIAFVSYQFLSPPASTSAP